LVRKLGVKEGHTMGHGRPTLPSHLTSGSELPLLGLLKNMSLAL